MKSKLQPLNFPMSSQTGQAGCGERLMEYGNTDYVDIGDGTRVELFYS